jgi:hypothetical protein
VADDDPVKRNRGFPWQETCEQLEAFAAAFPAAVASADGRTFAVAGAGLKLPLVLPEARPGEGPLSYAARMQVRIGRQCVLLVQAGATAIGWWDEDEVVRHRARKRYVVRGSGKAQPKHLRTKGKSRYGSRLRLQNWQRLLVEANETLHAWWQELGTPEQVFWSVPIRAWTDLAAAGDGPPFQRDGAGVQRIPLHVHVPDFEELQRVRQKLARGRLSLPADGGPTAP